jgi:pyruvate carboxylase subunit B
MSKKLIKFMNTSFRDGFQSVFGARVLTDDFLPALEACREAGMDYFEAGGGARFQSLYFYCNEDAFQMMDKFKETAGPDAKLQTLARGINVVGLESQSSDIINLHAMLFKKHGISKIRNFDALNDVNNLIHSGKCIVNAGLEHEVVVSMMALPPGASGAHDPEFYIKTLKGILDADIPYTSVCFKDASGTTTPKVVYDTIKEARKTLPENTHIQFHTHETAGIGALCYKAALDAGADGIDLAMVPVSGGTCQTDIITMWHILRGTEYDLDIDIKKVREAEMIFSECMKNYFVPPEAKTVEPLIPFCPMPGGALTSNTQMMRDNGIMDKFPEVIKAMEEVVIKGGFGTSVTPVSQFYFQQAFNNVLFGPWVKIADSYGKMVLGYFGKTPLKPDPEIIKIASEQLGLEPTTRNPLDLNDEDPDKGIEAAKKLLKEANIQDLSDENIFIAATCKEKGITFLEGNAKMNVRKIEKVPETTDKEGNEYTVTINSKKYNVIMDGNSATVNGKEYNFDVQIGSSSTSMPIDSAAKEEIKAPMPGNIMRIEVKEGDKVNFDQPLLILEAMKMETQVVAPKAGIIQSIKVSAGDQVKADQVLLTIS